MVAGVRHPRSCKAAQVEISQMSELGLTRGTSCPLLGEGEGVLTGRCTGGACAQESVQAGMCTESAQPGMCT